MLNWNIGNEEIGRRAKWDIYLEGRKLDISLYGVQATKQTYYHIELGTYRDRKLGLCLNDMTDSIKYYAYVRDSIEYPAYKLFFTMQYYCEEQKDYNKTLLVMPIFEDKREHNELMKYVKKRKDDSKKDVEKQNMDERFPLYSESVNTVISYYNVFYECHVVED